MLAFLSQVFHWHFMRGKHLLQGECRVEIWNWFLSVLSSTSVVSSLECKSCGVLCLPCSSSQFNSLSSVLLFLHMAFLQRWFSYDTLKSWSSLKYLSNSCYWTLSLLNVQKHRKQTAEQTSFLMFVRIRLLMGYWFGKEMLKCGKDRVQLLIVFNSL